MIEAALLLSIRNFLAWLTMRSHGCRSYDDISADSCSSALRGLFEFHVGLSLELMKRHLFAPCSSVVNVSMCEGCARSICLSPRCFCQFTPLWIYEALCASDSLPSAMMAPQGVRALAFTDLPQ